MQQPPLLPEEITSRVLRTTRRNGLSVALAAGFFALISAAAGDRIGAVAALIIAGTGAMELHGGSLLQGEDARGMGWLVFSQLLCLVSILAYCAVRLVVVDIPPMPAELQPMIAADAQQLGMTPEELLLKSYRLGYFVLAGAAVVYQGGMAVYYARRRTAVSRYLSEVGTEA